VRLAFILLWVELIFTIITILLYITAFIVLFAAFGYCAFKSRICTVRSAAAVSKPFLLDFAASSLAWCFIWSTAIYVLS
jgi:hypothetical protein